MMTAQATDAPPMPDGANRQFERFTNDMYGWAYRLVGRHHDALDVVQDVFLKWSRQCTSAMPAQPRSWLRRVTLNRAIDLVRQRRLGTLPDADLVDHPNPMPRLVGLEQDELRMDVSAALETLSDTQRAVLVAKVYDDMTFAQIAAELDVAVSTVKTHYVRAVGHVSAKLRSRWDREDLS